MPKSKRNKKVHLTQDKKKGKDHKEDLLRQLEQYVEKYQRMYLFDFERAKSARIMNLRLRLKDVGRIFSGKNSLISVTLKKVGHEKSVNFEDLLTHVNGSKGLLFSDILPDKLMEMLDKEFRTKLLGYAELNGREVRLLKLP